MGGCGSLPYHNQAAQLNYEKHRPESGALEIHLSSSGSLHREWIGGEGWGRAGEKRQNGKDI